MRTCQFNRNVRKMRSLLDKVFFDHYLAYIHFFSLSLDSTHHDAYIEKYRINIFIERKKKVQNCFDFKRT